MSTRALKITPAKAGTWTECPRRYRHTYLDRPAPPRTGGPWAHQSLGNSVHAALAAWLAEEPAKRTPSLAVAHLVEVWQLQGYRDDAHAGEWLGYASGWVEAYTEQVLAGARPVGVERSVAAHLTPGDPFVTAHTEVPWPQALIVEGRVDLVEDRGGQLVVVDYKTGKRLPRESDAGGSWALAVYVLAAGRTLRQRCARAELHHLPTQTVAGVDYDGPRLYRQIERLRDVAAEIEATAAATADTVVGRPVEEVEQIRDEMFPTRPSPLCGSCPFRGVCPAGQVVPEVLPWQFLATPAAVTV